MPRSSSPRSSSKSSSSKSFFSAPRPVVPSAPLPPALPSQIQLQPQSMMQNMKDGFGLGVGVSVARNMVDGLFNRFSSSPAPTASAPPMSAIPSSTSVTAEYQKREFMQCMEKVQDYESCKKFLEEKH